MLSPDLDLPFRLNGRHMIGSWGRRGVAEPEEEEQHSCPHSRTLLSRPASSSRAQGWGLIRPRQRPSASGTNNDTNGYWVSVSHQIDNPNSPTEPNFLQVCFYGVTFLRCWHPLAVRSGTVSPPSRCQPWARQSPRVGFEPTTPVVQ